MYDYGDNLRRDSVSSKMPVFIPIALTRENLMMGRDKEERNNNQKALAHGEIIRFYSAKENDPLRRARHYIPRKMLGHHLQCFPGQLFNCDTPPMFIFDFSSPSL